MKNKKTTIVKSSIETVPFFFGLGPVFGVMPVIVVEEVDAPVTNYQPWKKGSTLPSGSKFF